MNRRTISALVFGASALLPVTACNNDEKEAQAVLVISSDAADPGTQSTAPFNFGNVAILTSQKHLFTITNTGTADATIRDVTSEGIGLAAPFALVETPSADTPPAAQTGQAEACQGGRVLLANGGFCTITVVFAPQSEGSFSDKIEMNFSYENLKDGETKRHSSSVSLGVIGKGFLDCSLAPELADSRIKGVQAAKDMMAEDALRGKADGEALTFDDGKNAGYGAGHAAGYSAGYNSADGYPKGYQIGYAAGLNQGLTDPGSCSKGQLDGYNAGKTDGMKDGGNDGYDDGYLAGLVAGDGTGYSDGYNAGYYDGKIAGISDGSSNGDSDGRLAGYNAGYDPGYGDGYGDGYTDGANSCLGAGGQAAAASAGHRRSALTSAGPEQYIQSCYQQGYDATYTTGAYMEAYEKAKAANAQYQDGYKKGYSPGYAKGVLEGTADGYDEGYQKGQTDGFIAGYDQIYQSCFEPQYTIGYSDWYSMSYDTGYANGFNDGFDDAYGSSYASGYDTGYGGGYDDGYSPSYYDNYQYAYDSGYSEGYYDGYAIGYDQGYSDGQWDYCQISSARPRSSAMRRHEEAATTPKNRPTGYDSRKRAEKQVKIRGQVKDMRISRVQSAPKPERVRPFVPSRLPEMLESGFTPNQLDLFKSIRSGEPLSLRKFLMDRMSPRHHRARGPGAK